MHTRFVPDARPSVYPDAVISLRSAHFGIPISYIFVGTPVLLELSWPYSILGVWLVPPTWFNNLHCWPFVCLMLSARVWRHVLMRICIVLWLFFAFRVICMFGYWCCRFLMIRCSGYLCCLVDRFLGYLCFGLFGFLVFGLFVFLVFWLFVFWVFWLLGHLCCWLFVFWLFVFLVIWFSAYLCVWLFGFLVICVFGYLVFWF